MIYNKLVRDRVPEIVGIEGRACEVVVLDEEAYKHALRAKLVEEARETEAAESTELVTELADVLEVVDALLVAYDISHETVRWEQTRRRKERGSFSRKLYLCRVE